MNIILSKSLLPATQEIQIGGSTVKDILNQLIILFPALKDKLFKDDQVNKFINIYVDEENIKFLEDLNTVTTNAREMCIETAIAGG